MLKFLKNYDKMFVNEVNDVKIYNLSAGKSVPEVSWLNNNRSQWSTNKIKTSIFFIPVAYRSTQEVSVDEKG